MIHDERRQRLKDQFIQSRGWWADFWDQFLDLDPELFEAFIAFSTVPWKKGHLSPKVKEYIYCAIDVATTHLYEPGLRIHLRNAFKFGASAAEIMEVYELVALMGMHTMAMGVPVLIDELQQAGMPAETTLGDAQLRLKQEFMNIHGWWTPAWESLLAINPEWFSAYLAFSAVPARKGFLEPKVREFVCLAVDAATTHMYEPGLRLHIRNALRLGASREEIMEVLELVSILGMHTISMGVPVLAQELSDHRKSENTRPPHSAEPSHA